MAEPVDRPPGGTPSGPRFGDVYRSAAGGFAQARQLFLQGCGLPQAWAGRERWQILEAGFGLGLNFLAAWRAWKDDPQRPRLLHFVSMQAQPVAASDIVRGAGGEPGLQELAAQLAQRWWGLVPGFHRLQFEGGRVLLTLCVGEAPTMLQEQSFAADSVFLDGFEPGLDPALWELATLKAVARCCRRGTRLATGTVAGEARRNLAQCGFQAEKGAGLPPQRENLRAVFDPSWDLRHPPPLGRDGPGTAIVVGAGLAGASAASSLARRGWRVQVLDAAVEPAAGASALPAGLLAPHTSPDDNLLSRLSRAGVRITMQEARDRLAANEDWAPTGVLERRADGARLPALGRGAEDWQRPAQAGGGDLWHEAAAWIRPGALVRSWLAEPGVSFQGGTQVAKLEARDGAWRALASGGRELARSDLAVVAAALDTAALLPGALPLHAVRGQVSWQASAHGLPASHPVNGNGHWIPDVPLPGGRGWITGSTYGRGERATDLRPQDHEANLERLRVLVPALVATLEPAFRSGSVRGWAGVRCASADRRPLLGEVAPGLWVSTAMGSRGLTFAALCAELLAARLHGEPLPLPARLAGALDARRATRAAAAPSA